MTAQTTGGFYVALTKSRRSSAMWLDVDVDVDYDVVNRRRRRRRRRRLDS